MESALNLSGAVVMLARMTRLFRLGGPAVLLSVIALAGCTDEEPPSPPPTESASTSAGASESANEEPPVEGEPMDLTTASVTLTGGGWKVEEGLLPDILNAERGPVYVTLVDLGTTTMKSPREVAKLTLEGYGPSEVEVGYDAELGGEPAYEILGGGSFAAQYEYGAVHMGRAASVGIAFLRDLPVAKQKAIVDEVLAGFAWK